MPSVIRIGTRKSRLAMVQSELAAEAIRRAAPDTVVEMIPVTTKGDRILDRSLIEIGGKGVFTKELEELLLEGKADIAIHSAKDLPAEIADGLEVVPILPRAAVNDVVLTVSGTVLRDLPAGAVVGTSSLRRELQVRRICPQAEIRSLRGSVPTRIEKLRNGEYDAILLAAAGVERLGIAAGVQPAAGTADSAGTRETLSPDPGQDVCFEYLDPVQFLPAAGQGILAAEVRRGEYRELLRMLSSRETSLAFTAERTFMTAIGGSCNAPCGAYCEVRKDGMLLLHGMYAEDAVTPEYRTAVCRPEDTAAAEAAEELAAAFLRKH